MFVGMQGDTFHSRFPMPFKGSAQIGFRNDGAVAVPVRVEWGATPLAAWDAKWGYFHACWNRTGPEDVGRPHPIVQARGRGKYAGCFLSVISEDQSWWMLEGDESIRVNGEDPPSWRGTGLEDYFNGGWYYRNVMAKPLHGLLVLTPFRTIQYRFHLVDPVRFESGVDMVFERGPHHASRGWMESVGYYYLDAPGPVTLAVAPERRPPPADPFEDKTLMTQVLDQERLGDFAGARDRIAEFLERRPDAPGAAVLQLRQIACDEILAGFDAVRGRYEEVARTAGDPAAASQAQALMGFHENKANALLGAYCNARTAIFIDGNRVGQVDHPAALSVFPLRLEPGKHVMVLQAQWSRPTPWAQVYLRTHGGDLASGHGWKCTRQPTGAFQSLAYDDSAWDTVSESSKGPPEEPFFVAEPNAFAGMQSRARGMPAFRWNELKDAVTFRKVFEIR
jgi:hypothetical protein